MSQRKKMAEKAITDAEERFEKLGFGLRSSTKEEVDAIAAKGADLQAAFEEADRAVAACIAGFEAAGDALSKILAWGLFRCQYKTFAEYLEDRHGIKSSHAYRLIQAAEVMKCLRVSPIGDTGPLPQNEAQARELVCVPDKKRPEVWKAIVEEAATSGVSITAKRIEEHTRQFSDKPKPDCMCWNSEAESTALLNTLRPLVRRWIEHGTREAVVWWIDYVLDEFGLLDKEGASTQSNGTEPDELDDLDTPTEEGRDRQLLVVAGDPEE